MTKTSIRIGQYVVPTLPRDLQHWHRPHKQAAPVDEWQLCDLPESHVPWSPSGSWNSNLDLSCGASWRLVTIEELRKKHPVLLKVIQNRVSCIDNAKKSFGAAIYPTLSWRHNGMQGRYFQGKTRILTHLKETTWSEFYGTLRIVGRIAGSWRTQKGVVAASNGAQIVTEDVKSTLVVHKDMYWQSFICAPLPLVRTVSSCIDMTEPSIWRSSTRLTDKRIHRFHLEVMSAHDFGWAGPWKKPREFNVCTRTNGNHKNIKMYVSMQVWHLSVLDLLLTFIWLSFRRIQVLWLNVATPSNICIVQYHGQKGKCW